MAFQQFYNRVMERTYSGGTGNIQLAGRLASYFSFSQMLVDGESQYVVIEDTEHDELELCLATYIADTNQLARGAILASSNNGLRVDFFAGSAKRVFAVCPAEKINELFEHEQDKHFTHAQAIPLAVWDIVHTLNKEPSVTVVDSTGRVVLGRVEYLSLSQVRVTFSGAFAGQAHLN